MSTFEFNKQKATQLYRKWYVESNKSFLSNYDKEQVDDLSFYLLSELHDLLEYYKNQKLKVYRAELPMLYIRYKKIETFPNEIFVIENSIQSLNMPGCMAVGNSIDNTFENYFKAVIECSDARYKNGLGFMNVIHTMQMFDMNSKDLKREDVVNELINAGWNIRHEGIYNTVFLSSGNKVTYTLPKSDVILSTMVFWFRKLQFQISAKVAREMYPEMYDDTY